MLSCRSSMANGLGLRPAQTMDAPFLSSLFRSTRRDLRLIDAGDDWIETLIDFQERAQCQGYGDAYPDAMTFIVEKLGERVGRVVVAFGEQEVRLLDISLIEAVHGQGFGRVVLQALQQAAGQVKTPLTLCVLRHNGAAKRFYDSLGFQVAASDQMVEWLIWYPALFDRAVHCNNH